MGLHWSSCPEALAELLDISHEDPGWTDLMDQLGVDVDLHDHHKAILQQLKETLRNACRVRLTRRSSMSEPEAWLHVQRAVTPGATPALSCAQPDASAQVGKLKWRTRRQRGIAMAVGQDARAKVEETERHRWVDATVQMLKDSGAPVVDLSLIHI